MDYGCGTKRHEPVAGGGSKRGARATAWRFAWVLLVGVVAGTLRAGPLDSACTVADLDLPHCQAFREDKPAAVDPNCDIRVIFGLADVTRYVHPWSAGRIDLETKQGETFSYRLAFKAPVKVGSLLFTTQRAAILKPDAPYPGDPRNPAHWLTVAVPAAQCETRLAALPQVTSTRAVLFSDHLKSGQSRLWLARVFAARLHNVAPMASARARTEYVEREGGGNTIVRIHRAADVVRGRGGWASNGKNAEGNMTGPFVDDVHPQWFVLGWETTLPLAGIFMIDNFAEYRLATFAGAAATDPQLGLEEEWKLIAPNRYTSTFRPGAGRCLEFAEPVATKGLRIRITKATNVRGEPLRAAAIESLCVLSDLGDQPVPAARQEPEPPPFPIAYQVPEDGTVTVAVDTPEGTRLRNLVARVERKAGDNREFWDLKDDAGKLVPPGTYRWKGITAPPLKLRYQMSLYPNTEVLFPDRTAWFNGQTGPGGWLADHTPPFAVATFGDHVFFSAPVPENGCGFVCADLTGKRLWGLGSFDAWSGAMRMAADAGVTYVENGQGGGGVEDTDRVWAIDLAKQNYRTVLKVSGSEERRRGIKGMAAHDGKLYLAIRGNDNWFENAANGALVDILRCLPWYKEQEKPKRPYQIMPNPRDDFMRLFRLTGTVPGCYALTYLESDYALGKKAYIRLCFTQPINIGSCVYPVPQKADYEVKLSVAKPDAPYPPDPRQKEHWIPFVSNGKLPWDVALAPPNTSSRALLITFDKGGGEDDIGEELEAETSAPGEEQKLEGGDGGGKVRKGWRAQLEGLKILRRRFTNLMATAEIRVNSGTVAPDRSWDAQRQEPLSAEQPGIYAMQWKDPVDVRGLAVMEIDGKRMEIDAWTGSVSGEIDINGSAGWEKVGQYLQSFRDYHSGFASANMNARYLDGYVDFGRQVKTRALRLRIVEQWPGNVIDGDKAPFRPDRKDTWRVTNCGVFGVAPLAYAGGEKPVDPLICERLEVVDGASGKIERELPLPKAGDLSLGPDKTLYAISNRQVIRVDLEAGKHQPVVTDAMAPTALAVDSKNQLYVFDAAPERRVIRVYDPAGKYRRDIGEPGGYRVGPWNVNRFNAVNSLAIDKEDKIWLADTTYFPKRDACFKTDGTFVKDIIGPTCYGGAGVLDPGDRRRVFYGPMEFEIDWATGKSRLKNLTWKPEDGWAAGEIPIRVNGRTYMVTRPSNSMNTMACGIVYLYETDHLRAVAALGAADAFAPLKAPAILGALKGQIINTLQFLWADANGDGQVQFDECRFAPKKMGPLTPFNRDLGIQAGKYRYEVKEFLPNGAPVYAEATVPLDAGQRYMDSQWYRLNNGSYYRLGPGGKHIGDGIPEVCRGADGKLLWTYPSEGAGVGPDRSCGPFTPGQVVCQFCIVGHETAPAAGELGEFFVINTNFGTWHVWTADGLLASRLFRDLRDPKRVSWSMPEHERNMVMDDVTVGQEHFLGWFCRAEDGKYYAIAGHNHMSVVEVQGFEKFKRLGGELKVTQADVTRVLAWEKEMAKWKSRESPKVYDSVATGSRMNPDGNPEDWEGIPAIIMDNPVGAPAGRSLSFRMCYDKDDLYLLYEIRGAGPFQNCGTQWDKLFKTGACADLMIAGDPQADPARKMPVRGDKRVLLAMMQGKPAVVLYDPVNPIAPPAEKWEVVSPVARADFDSVKQVAGARFGHKVITNGDPINPRPLGYVIEAVVPLKALGLTPEPGLRLKFDWGVLETDAQGNVVLSRTYWANKATSTLADAPTESRLEPDMWGVVRFQDKPTGAEAGPRLEEDAAPADTGGLKLDED